MNGYSNILNKNSFSIEIITCDEAWKGEDSCASDEDIKDFVSHIVLT